MGESGAIEYCIATDSGLALKLCCMYLSSFLCWRADKKSRKHPHFCEANGQKFVMLVSARYRSLKLCQKRRGG